MTDFDDKDLLDFDFELPPLRKLDTSEGAEPSAEAAPVNYAEEQTETPAYSKPDINDILSAPDKSEDAAVQTEYTAESSYTQVSYEEPQPAEDSPQEEYSQQEEYVQQEEPQQEYSEASYAGEAADDGLPPLSVSKHDEPKESTPGKISVSTPASQMFPDGIPGVKKPVSTPASAGGISVGKKPSFDPSKIPAGGISVGKKSDAAPKPQSDDFDLPPLREAPPEEPTAPAAKSLNAESSVPPKTPEPPKQAEPDYIVDDEDYDYDGKLEDMDTSGIVLEDMDQGKKRSSRVSYIRTGAQDAAKSIKNQVLLDDMSIEMKDRPVLEDLSSEYAPETKQKRMKDEDNFVLTKKLDDSEKLAIKNRLNEEMGSRPKHFNQRASNAMYNRLMEEKRIKKAKKGLLMTIGVMLMTIACAAITYIGIMPMNELYLYLAGASLVFSLMMMIKSKKTKVLCTLYFSINTIILAGPGLTMYILDQENHPDPNFNLQVVWFAAAIILSIAAIAFLCKSETIDAYYTTSFRRKSD